MAISVLHVCDKFGVAGSSIHGVSRLFSWWFPRYDSSRFEVSLCGLKPPEPASRLLEEQGIPVEHLGRGRFDPRILSDLIALARRRKARILHLHGYEIETRVVPGTVAETRFQARAAGRFPIHVHAGQARSEAVLAYLEVYPE